MKNRKIFTKIVNYILTYILENKKILEKLTHQNIIFDGDIEKYNTFIKNCTLYKGQNYIQALKILSNIEENLYLTNHKQNKYNNEIYVINNILDLISSTKELLKFINLSEKQTVNDSKDLKHDFLVIIYNILCNYHKKFNKLFTTNRKYNKKYNIKPIYIENIQLFYTGNKEKLIYVEKNINYLLNNNKIDKNIAKNQENIIKNMIEHLEFYHKLINNL